MSKSGLNLLFLSLLCAQHAYGQSTAAVASGQAFASTIAPTSSSQVVNPAGVSASAWGSQSDTPTSVPSDLGGFSTPTTDSSLLTTAQTGGLTAMGDQAMTNCASYVPGSDQYENQYCAAVNFLNDQCMQPTTGEHSVLGITGTTQGASANCSGTYGAGQSQFNFGDQVSSSDSIFSSISNLGSEESSALQPTCTTQTVVAQPAQYTTSTCVTSSETASQGCSQQLNVTATDNTVPATLTQVGCVAPWITLTNGGSPSGCIIVAPDSLGLQTGDVYDGLIILHGTTSGSYGAVYTDGWDGYNHLPPNSMGGESATCLGTIPLDCYEDAFAQAGYTYASDYSIATEWYSTGQGYSCPSGATLSGTNCITQSVSTSWSDNCSSLDGGTSLPAPTQ
jgi:hypothetical protein